MAKASLNWEDPLLLESQLAAGGRQGRNAAQPARATAPLISTVHSVSPGGCAPRSVCTVPATAPASRIAPSHRTPTAARRWAPAGGQSHGSASATKASALDA